MDTVKICEGISELSDSYSGFLIDQWGTLHDGEQPRPNAIEALEILKSRGKQIIVISNSGQREKENIQRLEKIGFPKDLFHHVITSGEMTWQSLKNRDSGIFSGLGDKCFLLNRDNNRCVLDETGISTTDTIDEADFILLTGSDAPEKTLENYYDEILRKASRKRLKMFCANPEMKVTIGGVNMLGSGEIAQRYEEFGGVVTYIGKPFPSMFQYAMSRFDNVLPSQIVMIGDSLSHDIIGARSIDMDCALIANGVHSPSFSKVKSTTDIHKVLKTLAQNYGGLPTYFIPRFNWGKALPDRKNKRKQTKK